MVLKDHLVRKLLSLHGILAYRYEVHSKIIFPFSRVSDFAWNLRAQKLNKSQTKQGNITGAHYLCAHHQVVSTSSFIPYPLLILIPHSSLFVPTFLFASTSASDTSGLCRPRNDNTASPPNPLTRSLAAAETSSPTTTLLETRLLLCPADLPPTKDLPYPPDFAKIFV